MKTDKMKPTSEPCFSQGEKVKFHRTTIAICGPAGVLSEGEIEANAEFIADAFTVFHETGLTPRQILEQRGELLKTLETYDGTNSSQRWKTFRKHALAAIQDATAKGDTPA